MPPWMPSRFIAPDYDLQRMAKHGCGVPSQDLNEASQFLMSDDERAREFISSIVGMGLLAGMSMGITLGAMLAGLLGGLGGVLGAVAGTWNGTVCSRSLLGRGAVRASLCDRVKT